MFALLLAAAVLTVVGRPATSEAQDVKKATKTSKTDADLQGVWKLSKVYDKYEGGNQSYISLSSKYVMTIQDGNLTIETENDGKKATTKYTVNVDGNKKPKEYTRTAVEGKKGAVTGLYSVEKDKLLMCFQADGKPPEGFTVKRDDGKDRRIYEFERVKP